MLKISEIMKNKVIKAC